MNNNIRSRCSRLAAGFTLVELMVVVLIVAILAAVAFPGYKNQVLKTRRSAAKACLLQYSQLMERYYTTYLDYDYVTRTTDVNPVPPGCATEGGMADHYGFTVPTLSTTSYVIVATRTSNRDTTCGDFTIDQRGNRDLKSGTPGAGNAATVASCWR